MLAHTWGAGVSSAAYGGINDRSPVVAEGLLEGMEGVKAAQDRRSVPQKPS